MQKYILLLQVKVALSCVVFFLYVIKNIHHTNIVCEMNIDIYCTYMNDEGVYDEFTITTTILPADVATG